MAKPTQTTQPTPEPRLCQVIYNRCKEALPNSTHRKWQSVRRVKNEHRRFRGILTARATPAPARYKQTSKKLQAFWPRPGR